MGALLAEMNDYPVPIARQSPPPVAPADSRVFVPLQLETESGILSLIGTTVFGTPVDVTVAEIALECFFPADAVTADYLQERQRSPA
jgi:hypothetical protein